MMTLRASTKSIRFTPTWASPRSFASYCLAALAQATCEVVKNASSTGAREYGRWD